MNCTSLNEIAKYLMSLDIKKVGLSLITPHHIAVMYIASSQPCIKIQSHPLRTGRISANTMQLFWGDWKMRTAISCTKCSPAADFIHATGRSSSNVAAVLRKSAWREVISCIPDVLVCFLSDFHSQESGRIRFYLS